MGHHHDTEIDRRSLLAMLACGCACPLHQAQAAEQLDVMRLSCSVPDSYARNFNSTALNSPSLMNYMNALLRKSGNPSLDFALDKALYRIAGLLEVMPSFGFDSDPAQDQNAWASNTVTPELNGPDGTVGYGVGFFKRWMGHDSSGVAALAVAAHEFGHIKLFKSGQYRQILNGQKTVKRIELHADAMAGFSVGRRRREVSGISMKPTAQMFWEIGDTNFDSPGHHGTPRERLDAANFGYRVGKEQEADGNQMFTMATDYVMQR